MESMEEAPESSAPKKKKVKPGSFQGLNLGRGTFRAIMSMGYKLPTPIQRKTIPVILDGQDLVAMARTGSGKTAAFLIPTIERLGSHSLSVGVRAVMLSPTRELAMQTAKFCRQLGRNSGLRCCLLVGGQAMEQQFEHLADNPDIVIATPGRLMHHTLEAELSLSRVEILVFDEADRLFELGFADQLQQILDKTPSSRQCLLFSATLPAQLVAFSRAGVKNPVFVRLDVEATLSEALDLWYLYVRKDEKLAATVAVLRHLHAEGKSTVMFVATRHHVEFFGEFLGHFGLPAAIVYGSMDPVARTEEVAKFRRQKARILVTTDVAARGIDIPFLDHVLNFDFPSSAKLFVHRSGRTARAGRSGVCASLVTLDDLPYAVELMLFLGHKVSVPSGTPPPKGAQATPMIGAVPGLEHEVERITELLEKDGTVLHSLHKSMMASYRLYNKTRPTASKQSVARAKQLLEECGGAGHLQALLHPALAGTAASSSAYTAGPTAGGALLQELRGFRPRAEKPGNVISPGAMRLMERAKLEASAVAAPQQDPERRASESLLLGPSPSAKEEAPAKEEAVAAKSRSAKAAKASKAKAGAASEGAGKGTTRSRPTSADRPRISKRRRLRLSKEGSHPDVIGTGAGDAETWDVQVDGRPVREEEVPPGKQPRRIGTGTRPVREDVEERGQKQQFYLSVERDQEKDAKERGLEMEQYQMDLLPDDSTDIQRTKSVMRWDAKKKKYLPVMVSVDGRVVKKTRQRNEAGKLVQGERQKTNIYKKWAQSSKRRIQKVGELEQPSRARGQAPAAGPGGSRAGTVDFGAPEAEAMRPVVPFHGEVDEKYLTHKQKRLLKRRAQLDTVLKGTGKQEVKTARELQKEKKRREQNKVRQDPKLRKKQGREWMKQHKARLEERQMKFGARTRSRMLIFEGPKKGKAGKGARKQRPMRTI